MKIKKNIQEILINKMFEMSGHDVKYSDIVNAEDEWYLKYTMTDQQNDDWVSWGIDYIRKKLKITHHQATVQMYMFNLTYGLKISNK